MVKMKASKNLLFLKKKARPPAKQKDFFYSGTGVAVAPRPMFRRLGFNTPNGFVAATTHLTL
jgi:hypothetical protein